MNYANYERSIVEKYGVELTGWPIHGHIRNPGELSSDDNAILKDALVHRRCKWRRLTPAEVSARKDSNKQREANGETVYGPTRKSCTRKACVIDNEMQVDDHFIDENTA
jgi:hypothetical protein